MTQPTHPSDKQFARDVAKQVDRRRMRRRFTLWTALLALVSAAAFYLRCGGSLGLSGLGGGGGDGGDSDDRAPRTVAGPARCAVRLTPEGVILDSRPSSRDHVIDACKNAAQVDIYPTGNMRHGDVEELRAALQAAGARRVRVRDPGAQGESPSDTPTVAEPRTGSQN